MKEKSEVNKIFNFFFQKLVQTQFQAKLKILRTDNGGEYFNSILRDYFLSEGITHQSSCVDSPQQNRVF